MNFSRQPQKLAALAPAGALGADNRLFGTPASIAPTDPALANKLRLTFSRAAIPTAVWDETLNFIMGLAALKTSDVAKNQFSQSPRAYFEAAGVKTSNKFEKSKEVAMARLVMDENAISAASRGDYASFLRRIQDFNLPAIPDSQGLTSAITKLMRTNAKFYQDVKNAISLAGATNPKLVSDALSGPTLTAGIIETDTAVVSTDTIVVADTFLIVQVSIAAEIIAISAVVVAVVLIVAGVAPQTALTAQSGYGQISKLDNNLIDGAATAITAARLLGNKDFEIKVATDMVHREIEAIVSASEAVGLLQINPNQRETLLNTCKVAAERSLGLTV